MQKQQKKSILAAALGNTLEWYDFAIYGYFAITIGELFFPHYDTELAIFAAFAAFAVGYLARPLGAVIFGHIGDKFSRRGALIGAIGLMTFATLAVAILPTYAQIGIYAPLLLVLFRIIAGISIGGEYISSAVYVLESTQKNKYFNLSLIITGATVGFLLGSLVSITLNTFVPPEWQAQSWRLAFLFGIVIAIFGIFIRRHIAEVPAQDTEKIEIPIYEVFKNYKIKVLQNLGANLFNAVIFYTLFVYLISWLTDIVGENRAAALDANFYGLIALVISVLIGGFLPKYFSKKQIIMTTMGLIAIVIYPVISLISHHDPIYEIIGEVSLALMLGLIFPPLLVLQLENFKSNVRISGCSLAYNLSWGIFGGTAPMVASWLLLETHDILSFSYYIILAAVISLFSIYTIPEQKNKTKTLEANAN